MEPKEISSCLIPRLLVVFTRQLKIVVTTLTFGDSAGFLLVGLLLKSLKLLRMEPCLREPCFCKNLAAAKIVPTFRFLVMVKKEKGRFFEMPFVKIHQFLLV